MRPLTKTVLTLAVLLAAPLFVPMELRASVTNVWIIKDLTEGPVTVYENGVPFFTFGPEAVFFTLSNGGQSFLVDHPVAGLSEPGTSPLQYSDKIAIGSALGGTIAGIVFTSDVEGHLFPCSSIPGGCAATEDGTSQTLATITWSGGSKDIFKVQSDPNVLSVTPEPSSALLFGTGLLALVFALKKAVV